MFRNKNKSIRQHTAIIADEDESKYWRNPNFVQSPKNNNWPHMTNAHRKYLGVATRDLLEIYIGHWIFCNLL